MLQEFENAGSDIWQTEQGMGPQSSLVFPLLLHVQILSAFCYISLFSKPAVHLRK